MELSTLGILVQTVGAALLSLVLFYLSRGNGNRVLKAAGFAWLFLFLSLAATLVTLVRDIPLSNLPSLYLRILSMVALLVAAQRMDHEASLVKALGIAIVVGAAAAFGIVLYTPAGPLFQSVYRGLLGLGWLLVTILISRNAAPGLGRKFAGLLAFLTLAVQLAYVVLFGLSAARGGEEFSFLSYVGFYDLFLEMFFGVGLIIFAMEDTEARLSTVHARVVDDTQRSKRRVQIDPLTDAYNRFFLDEIRPSLAREQAGGSIVLIDVDGLKTINDQEGHEEGDKAIWTVAAAIKKLIRGDDTLIRWGGDEFLVILRGMDEELAKKRFYMLPAKIEEVRQSQSQAPRAYKKFLAASVGITPFSTRLPFDIAIETADRVMYERKKAHKQMRGTEGERRSSVTASMRRFTDKTG